MNNLTKPEQNPRYGWVMVAVASILMGMGVGSLWSIAIFLKPILAEFGWLRGQTTFAFMAGTVSMGVGGIVMGALADRYSTRWVVLIGALGLGSSYLLLARVTSAWEFYLFYCLMGGVGSAALWAPLLANVGGWFEHNKGLAMGLTMSGVALGNAGMIKFAGYLIVLYGWQQAYSTLGLICLAVLVPVSLLVRNPPQRETSPGASNTLRTPATRAQEDMSAGALVGWLGLAAFFCCISFSTNLVHLAALTQDLGFDSNTAATVLFLLFLSSFVGRVSFGKLSDSIGGVASFLLSASGQTLLIFWFTQLHSLAGLSVLALVFGLVYSGTMTSLMIAVREIVPLHKRGISLGVVNLFGWIGNGLGGYQGGYFFDQSGNYTTSYAIAAFCGLVAVGILGRLLLQISQQRRRGTALAVA